MLCTFGLISQPHTIGFAQFKNYTVTKTQAILHIYPIHFVDKDNKLITTILALFRGTGHSFCTYMAVAKGFSWLIWDRNTIMLKSMMNTFIIRPNYVQQTLS